MRCKCHYQIEIEPFLGPAVASYALSLERSALVREVNALPIGKQPLRDVYALHPDSLPVSIRHHSKVPLGAGMDGR